MIEVTIANVGMVEESRSFVLILKELETDRYLIIGIGPMEAQAIGLGLSGEMPPRPLTHDLLHNTIQEMGATVRHIVVTKLENGTFYGRVFLNVNGSDLDIDSRPSDAVALAVRADVPIFVNETVMDEAGILPEETAEGAQMEEDAPEEVPEAFRDFLEDLDIDDLE